MPLPPHENNLIYGTEHLLNATKTKATQEVKSNKMGIVF